MYEITTQWVVPGTPGGTTVMYWADDATEGVARQALQALYTATAPFLVTGAQWTIATTGRILNESTGTLIGVWTESTARTGAGSSGTNSVANATQLLYRWGTGQILNGRFVKGRTNIPGYSITGLANGQVNAAAQTALNAAATTFVTAASGFGVWHRPSSGSGGAHVVANSGSVWAELATQRRRRQ